MNKLSTIKQSVITALCVALCVVLSQAFHAIPNAGSIYSPMHIPVFLCGLICSWPFGLLCGILGPLFSSLLTGMPGAAYLPQMIIELAAYGVSASIFMCIIKTKNTYIDLYASLIGSMLFGRIIAGLARALIFAPNAYSFTAWTTSYFVKAIPGIILHLLIIPSIVFALMKARAIPARYSKSEK